MREVVVDVDHEGRVRGRMPTTGGLVLVRVDARCEWQIVIRVLDEIVAANAQATTPLSVVLVAGTDRMRSTKPITFARNGFQGLLTHVEVDRDGTMVLEGARVQSIEALRARSSRIITDGDKAIMEVDRETEVGLVVDATRIVQDAGANVFFGVRPIDTAGGATPARPLAAAWAECPFPIEADKADIDMALVSLQAEVDAEGRATRVTIQNDPGHGFGPAAQACALRGKYEPARDPSGAAAAGTTKPFRVRFQR